MSNPSNKPLVTASGNIAPQHYNAEKESWDYQLGKDGSLYTEDRKLIEAINKISDGAKLHYFKKGEELPSVNIKDGDIALNVNNWSDLHFRYQGKWETRK